MFRIAIVLLIIYALYVLWKRVSSKKRSRPVRHACESLPPGEMVPCEKCQTFVLKNEAIEKEGKYYCSKSCIL